MMSFIERLLVLMLTAGVSACSLKASILNTDPTKSSKASSFPIPILSSNLKKAAGQIRYARLTPDETKVVFTVNSINEKRFELWVANIDGSGLTLLSKTLAGEVVDFEITPDSQKVVFIGTVTNSRYRNLYSINMDGTGLFRINGSFSKGDLDQIGENEGVVSFKMSPDGTRILYQFLDGDRDNDPYWATVNIDGTSNNAPPTEQAETYDPDEYLVSNTKIIYKENSNFKSANWDWTSQVYIQPDNDMDSGASSTGYKSPRKFILKSDFSSGFSIASAGMAITAFNTGSAGVTYPKMMPNYGMFMLGAVSQIGYNYDQTKVFYIADETVFTRRELYVMNLNGSGTLGLSLNTTGTVKRFFPSPVNGKVAFIADMVTIGQNELFIVNSDATGFIKLNAPLASGGNVDLNSVQFTSDGSAVMYAAQQEAPGRLDYYKVNVDGTNLTRLNHDFSGTGAIKLLPKLFASSSQLMYVADDDGNGIQDLFVRNLLSGTTVKINSSYVLGYNYDGLLNITESLDGQKLILPGAFSSNADASGANLNVYDRSTGQLTRVAQGGVSFGFSADSQKMYYVYGQLYVANADGSNPQMISDGTESISKVFYLSNNKLCFLRYVAPSAKLILINLDGTGRTEIATPGAYIFDVRLSPDGQKIVYKTYGNLYAVNIDGSGHTQLNGAMVGSYMVAFDFRADSQKVIYQADQDVSSVYELFSVNLDGTGRIKLHPNLSSGRSVGSFSFTSSKVTYVANQTTAGLRELYVSNWDGTGNIKISGSFIGGATGVAVLPPLFSPDGQYVVFSADKNTANKLEFYSAKIDGSAAVKLNPAFTSPSSAELSLVKVSSKIIMLGDFEQVYRNKLYSINYDGTGLVDLAGAHVGLTTDFTDYTVLESQQKIVFRTNKDDIAVVDLYLVNLDGTGLTKLNTGAASGTVLRYKMTSDNNSIVFQVRGADFSSTKMFKVAVASPGSPVPVAAAMPSSSNFFSWWILGSSRLMFLGNGESSDRVDLYEDSL